MCFIILQIHICLIAGLHYLSTHGACPNPYSAHTYTNYVPFFMISWRFRPNLRVAATMMCLPTGDRCSFGQDEARSLRILGFCSASAQESLFYVV